MKIDAQIIKLQRELAEARAAISHLDVIEIMAERDRLREALEAIHASTTDLTCICCHANSERAAKALAGGEGV